MTPWAAKWMACCEDPHWRSMVVAGTDSGQPGGQHGVAADVERLLGDLHDAAHDHVVDQGRVELVALGQGLERLGGQVDGVPVAELPVALPSGGPDGVDDDGGGHGVSSQSGRGDRRHAGSDRRTFYPAPLWRAIWRPAGAPAEPAAAGRVCAR